MTVRIWTKPQTQAALRALTVAGLAVNKTPGGYIARLSTGKEVFRAMQGTRGYLVRYVADLFEATGDTHVTQRATPAA